jgi:2OG-Fe(II) oxygenase superfamily
MGRPCEECTINGRDVSLLRALDSAWLTAWVQPQHLVTGALAEQRQAFASHPARLGIVSSFLIDDVAALLHEFLAHEAEYVRSFGLYSIQQGVPKAEWLRAAERDRFYRMGVISGVARRFRLSRNVWTYLKFLRALADRRFIALFEAYSGLALGPVHVTAHSMTEGDFLLPHTDATEARRLTFVLFLTPQWTADSGGVLKLTAPDGHVSDVVPDYNSLIFFDVGARTEHAVSRIEPSAGALARVTISGWIEDGPPGP